MVVSMLSIDPWEGADGFLAITLPEAYGVQLQSVQILIFSLEEQESVLDFFKESRLGVAHFEPYPGAAMAFKVRKVTPTQSNVYVTLLWVDLALLFPSFYR